MNDVGYWMLYNSEVVFTAPKGYNPANKSCIEIDESKFNFIAHKGGRTMRLIFGRDAGNWWLV